MLFLIAVNALVLFGVTTIGISDPRTFMMTILVLFLPLFLVAVALQGIVYHLLRKRRVGDGTRALLFLLPVILVVLATPFLPTSRQAKNQQSPVTSPSSEYVLEVPIRNSAWTVRILDKEGRELYEDTASEFYGRFNSYWSWDDADRVWLFNSDTGEVLFWEKTEEGWKKERWGMITTRQIEREIEPPSELYPPYMAQR